MHESKNHRRMILRLSAANQLERGGAKPSSQAKPDVRAEFRKFLAAFGAERAALYFGADMTFDQAMKHFKNSRNYGMSVGNAAFDVKVFLSNGRKPAA